MLTVKIGLGRRTQFFVDDREVDEQTWLKVHDELGIPRPVEEVPKRCRTCKHWHRSDHQIAFVDVGQCNLLVNDEMHNYVCVPTWKAQEELPHPLTDASFGCTHWEPKP